MEKVKGSNATWQRMRELMERIVQVRAGLHGNFQTMNEKANEMSNIAGEALAYLDTLPSETAPSTEAAPGADAELVKDIAFPVRDYFGTLLDAENRQIGKAPPPYADHIVAALNSALSRPCAAVMPDASELSRLREMPEQDAEGKPSAIGSPYPLPEGWHVTIDCEKKQAIVTHPNIGGYAASDDPNNIAGTMLYWLAVALARAPIDSSDR